MLTKDVLAVVKDMAETVHIYKERGERLSKSKKKDEIYHGQMYLNLASELQIWIKRLQTN